MSGIKSHTTIPRCSSPVFVWFRNPKFVLWGANNIFYLTMESTYVLYCTLIAMQIIAIFFKNCKAVFLTLFLLPENSLNLNKIYRISVIIFCFHCVWQSCAKTHLELRNCMVAVYQVCYLKRQNPSKYVKKTSQNCVSFEASVLVLCIHVPLLVYLCILDIIISGSTQSDTAFWSFLCISGY